MSNQNDEMILKLKEKIESAKNKLSSHPKNFVSETSCIFYESSFDKKNLRTMNEQQLNELYIRLNAYRMSAVNCGILVEDVIISGFSLDKWLHDIKSRLDEIKYREEESKLKEDEKLLDSLLSDDKRTEMMLKNIAERLGM